MHPLRNRPVSPSTQPALELIGLAKQSPELARQNLRALLLANPNHFGKLTGSLFKAVLKIQEDTTWESIGCVGYSPDLGQLLAIIQVKQDSGYSGGICAHGSDEYVRFYLSYDGGANWLDQGLRSVNVSDTTGPKPLEYAVALQTSLRKDLCLDNSFPRVRAILSWNAPPPPGDPGWLPVWGNVAEANIQINASRPFVPSSLIAAQNASLPRELVEFAGSDESSEAVALRPLSPFELHMLYASSEIPEHRYLSSLLEKACAMPGLVVRQGAVSKSPRSLSRLEAISRLDLLSLVERWLNTSANTSYEQLEGVAFDLDTSRLIGILELKQSRGYSGGLETAGSKEFVAFWVDWGSGWEYCGTTSIPAHDFNPFPADRLCRSVAVPLDVHSRAAGAQAVRVRAVLSWNTPPSTTDPDAQVVWGNSLETSVLLSRGHALEQTYSALPESAEDASTRFGASLAGRSPFDRSVTRNNSERNFRGYPLILSGWDRAYVYSGQMSN